LRYLVRHYLGGSMERVLSTGLVPPDTSVPVPDITYQPLGYPPPTATTCEHIVISLSGGSLKNFDPAFQSLTQGDNGQFTIVLAASGTSVAGMPVSMVGTWLENATFSEVRFSGVRMSGARVAVTAGPAGADVPLFTITSGVADCVATLGQSQLPAAFTGAGGLFASAGCALSSTATVSVVTAGQCWTLTQSPALVTPGVEDVVYSVVLAGGALEVYASGISLVEQGDGSSYATSYTIAATTLPAASLSADTRCPNYTTKGANDSRGLSWPQMMTAPRPSLAALGQVKRPPRPGRETMPASSREQPPAR
jgi:hypothetical protein